MDYKYEVAISCTTEDESVAQELHDLLQPRVKSIFFYPENQKELIGQDGLQKFGSVFRTESRVVVVIYCEKWGKTPWTQVEENAIKEMCLNGGWARVILHSTDGTAPVWLPRFYIWSGSRYGLGALAAAVEQKIQEQGGQVGEEDVLAKAQRIRRSLAAKEAREARRFTEEAVHAARKERQVINERLADLVAALEPTYEGFKLRDSGADTIQGRVEADRYTVWAGGVAIFFRWTGNTVNSIRGDKLILCSGSSGIWGLDSDTVRNVDSYELELAEDDKTWRWIDRKGRHYTSSELAELGLSWLLDEHERRRKANLERRRRS